VGVPATWTAPSRALGSEVAAEEINAVDDKTAAEKTDKAYDLTIAAASLLGGFSMRDVIASPGTAEFGSAPWAFYLYRPLVAVATTLDLYAVIMLVLNRYLAARAYKDIGEAAHRDFSAATAGSRQLAVWAVCSLGTANARPAHRH
jgi:hypothetical protein